MGKLCDSLGISLAVNRTNLRGTYRKLAAELSQLEGSQENPELKKMLDQMRRWSNKQVDPDQLANKESNARKRLITMKEVGLRLYNKFGETLKLKKPPVTGLRIPTATKEKLQINITKFPKEFELTQDQLQAIITNTPDNKGQSSRRYLEVIKILNERHNE